MAEKRSKKTGRRVATGQNAERRITTNRAKGKAMGGQRTLDYMKPERFKDYLTITELAIFVPADISWIRKLEREDRIPKAQRVPMGKLQIRLWSPEQAEEIKQIIRGHKIGRPSND